MTVKRGNGVTAGSEESEMDRVNRTIERHMSADPKRADLTLRYAVTQRRSNNLRTLFAPWLDKLNTSSPTVQKQILLRLAALGPLADFAAESILNCLPSFHSEVSKIALPILRNFGEAAIPALTAILQKDEVTTRRLALREVAILGPKAESIVPVLKDCVNADENVVRILALKALSSVGAHSKEALAFLVETLEHPIPGTRRTACAQLKHFEDQAVEAVAILSQILKDDADIWMRCEAARGLTHLVKHAPVQTDFLFEMLNREQFHWEQSINNDITKILQHTGPQTITPLIALLNSDYFHCRLGALSALTAYGPQLEAQFPELFQKYLKESDRFLRIAYLDLFLSHPSSAFLQSQLKHFLYGFADEDEEFRTVSFRLCLALKSHSKQGLTLNEREDQGPIKSAFLKGAFQLLNQDPDRSCLDPRLAFAKDQRFPCKHCFHWNRIEAHLAYSQSPCSNCGQLLTFLTVHETDPYHYRQAMTVQEQVSQKQRKPKDPRSSKKKHRALSRPKANRQGLKRFLQSGRNPWLCSRRKDREDWIAQLLIHWTPKIEDYLRRADRRAWFAGPILVKFLSAEDLALSTAAFKALRSQSFKKSRGLGINLQNAVNSNNSRQVINALRLLQDRGQCPPLTKGHRRLIRRSLARNVRSRAEAVALLYHGGETVSMAGLEDLFENSYNNDLVFEFMTAAAFQPRRLKGHLAFISFALKHQNPGIRLRAAVLLGDSNLILTKSLPALLTLLAAQGDSNREVHRSILQSIEQIADFVRVDTRSPIQWRKA